MATDDPNRILKLRFEGEAIRDHSISVRLFTKSLESVQKLLLHLTQSRLEKEPTPGRSTASIVAECEMFLKPIEPNCVTANLTLPQKSESLFPELPDLAEEVLSDARNSFQYYSDGDCNPLKSMCPNPVYRKWIINDISGIAPSQKSDYVVHFIGNDKFDHRLVRPPRDRILEMLQDAEQEIPETVQAPQFVSAKGMAIIKGSNIVEWQETYDVTELDLEEVRRPKHINWGDCHLELVHPIAVAIEEQSEDLFLATFDMLGISAIGSTQEEAMEAFSEEFIVLWKEIAEENDEKLTPDAITLKRKLLSLVKNENLV